MAERIVLKLVIAVDTEKDFAIVSGITETGQVEIAFNKQGLPNVIAGLASCAAELKRKPGELLLGAFQLGAYAFRRSQNPAEVFLVLRCLPDQDIAFLLSPAQLEALGRDCVEAARTVPPTPAPRPN